MAAPATQDNKDNFPELSKYTPKYIPIETIINLHNKELSHSQIAKIVGCDPSNITNRLLKAGIVSLRDYKHNRADIFAVTQSRILNNITDDDIKKASMLQKATAIGIMYDKERLERDLSTANVATLHDDIAQLKARKQVKE